MYLMNVFTLLSAAKRQSFIWDSAIQEGLPFFLDLEATKVGMECIPSLAEMCVDVPLIGNSLIIGKEPLSEYNKVNIFLILSFETWTLQAVDQKHLESFEMWCWRRMEKISWTEHVRNEEVLLRVK